jgi:hypothetical protein
LGQADQGVSQQRMGQARQRAEDELIRRET